MKIAIAQYACTPEVDTNLATAERHIAAAGAAGAALVILPELHNTPYFCQIEDPARFDHAEPIPGPSTERPLQLAGNVYRSGDSLTKLSKLFRGDGLCSGMSSSIGT